MNRLILKRFGKKFIDSLRFYRKATVYKNHPDEIFSYEECDDISRYPNSMQTISLKNYKLIM